MTKGDSALGLDREKVRLSPYQSVWVEEFAQEAARLRTALGNCAIEIEHVGSTSIPGMAAKPLIDIMVTVPNLHGEPNILPRLEHLGYEFRPEASDENRLFLAKGARTRRTHHVHVVQHGGEEAVKLRTFRDYLKGHPEVAREYLALKLQLAAAHQNDRASYSAGKDEFIRRILALAVAKDSQ